MEAGPSEWFKARRQAWSILMGAPPPHAHAHAQAHSHAHTAGPGEGATDEGGDNRIWGVGRELGAEWNCSLAPGTWVSFGVVRIHISLGFSEYDMNQGIIINIHTCRGPKFTAAETLFGVLFLCLTVKLDFDEVII